MPKYAAEEIYRFARAAGFAPDQATTMTAIAMAESGGNTAAHNAVGEDSRGLWQINLDAHRSWAGGMDMGDPVQNALAAYRVSRSGADISPWTVTHNSGSARYLQYRDEAQAAAQANGDPAGLGVWTGTDGYGDPVAAGSGGGAPAPLPDDPDGGSGSLQVFLDSALAQAGEPYIFGAETELDDPDPDAWDCSELTQWAAHQAGVDLPDGSWLQYLELEQQGALIPVEDAINTPGALLFSFSSEPSAGGARPSSAHLAISLGDGTTIEARGRAYGVGSWSASDRFEYAAVVPGLNGTAVAAAAVAAAEAAPVDSPDTDRDELTDAMEQSLGLAIDRPDSDDDGLSDAYELLRTRSNPLAADTDGDQLLDSMELGLGTDLLEPDSDRDGRLDSASPFGATDIDTDTDRLADSLEQVLGTDPLRPDTDRDGFSDALEHRIGSDLLDPLSTPMSDPSTPTGETPAADAAGVVHTLPWVDDLDDDLAP